MIKPLFGRFFFEELSSLVEKAKDRILIASAFLDKSPFEEIAQKRPDDVPMYVFVREDSNFEPQTSISIKLPSLIYHGKIYVIDNNIIVGSHNLINHSVKNEGEFSIMITAEPQTVDAFLFSILYNIFVKNSKDKLDYINADILLLYQWDCPFCGNPIPDPFEIIECPGYGEGEAKYVSKHDCESYGNDGFCKVCLHDEHLVNRELYFCDDSGCGLGIDPKHGKFIKHAVNPPSDEYVRKAWKLVEIFNGICKYVSPEHSAKLLKDLGMLGKIFIADTIERGISDYLISLNFFKERALFFVEEFIKTVEEHVKRTLKGRYK